MSHSTYRTQAYGEQPVYATWSASLASSIISIMNTAKDLEHARLDLAVDSITLFMHGARVHRAVPVPQSGEVSPPRSVTRLAKN